MVAIAGFSRERIIDAVREMYTAVARTPGRAFHFPVGAEACRQVGYSPALLEGLPAEALESFAGVGCPFGAGAIRAGDAVLDIGSGSGTDTLVAARLVGPRGRVWSLDVTPAMAGKLSALVRSREIANVEVLEGSAEAIPLPDASVDAITSNGMLNLVPDKRRALAEMFRVLRPGGRVQVADIVIRRPMAVECEADPRLWAECVAGAAIEEDYLDLFRQAGFEDVRILRDHDYFSLSRSPETRELARRFGARAVEIAMTRGVHAPSRLARLSHRFDPRRIARSISRRGLAGASSLALAMLACYGSLAAAALLPLAGIVFAVNEAAVSATVLAFAALALAALIAGRKAHRSAWALAAGFAGAAILAYVHLVSFSLAVELAGFVAMGIGIALDLRERRRSAPTGTKAEPESAPERITA